MEQVTMIDAAIPQIARELQLTQGQVQATVGLLHEGATVPFIARYRKEATASLDEVVITSIRDRLSQLRELRDRREAILTSLKERDLLTEELRKAVLLCRNYGGPGGHLSALPSQAAHSGHHRPGKRDWNPWRCTSGSRRILTSTLPLLSTSIRNWGWQTSKMPWVEPGTSSPSGSAKTPPLGGQCGSCSGPRVPSPPGWFRVKTRQRPSTGITSSGEEPMADVPSHRVLAMLRGEREALLSVPYRAASRAGDGYPGGDLRHRRNRGLATGPAGGSGQLPAASGSLHGNRGPQRS